MDTSIEIKPDYSLLLRMLKACGGDVEFNDEGIIQKVSMDLSGLLYFGDLVFELTKDFNYNDTDKEQENGSIDQDT